MDKYEYKVRAEEIFNLIHDGEYAKAVEIADTIDWSRVKSIKTLCTISDLYKINRRLQESKEILLMAYERYPGGRLIVYSLCELSIKLDEYVQAIEYYKEYVQLAPKDTNKYILQYRLYEAQDVSLEERIEVLEEFKRKDYREKWAYELAYLYHRMGLASKCVDECDELIVTFGEGKYVIKAMELKALHEPLTASEQAKYDAYIENRDYEIESEKKEAAPIISDSISDVEASVDSEDLKGAPTTELPPEMDIQVKTVDVGQYNTMNLQEALAESMKELMDTDDVEQIVPSTPEEDIEDNTIFGTSPMAGPKYAQDPQSYDVNNWDSTGEIEQPAAEQAQPAPAQQIQASDIPVSIPTPDVKKDAAAGSILTEETKRIPTGAVVDYLETQKIKQQMQESTSSMQAADAQAEMIPGAITGQLEAVGSISSEFDQMLAEEYSGQISLVISEGEKIEKQITGQMSIDDVLAGWEETKKENERKREEEVRKRILQHTGSLFDEFDEDTRASLLEQLEKAFMDAILKEANGDDSIDSDKLGKKIRKEALRAVEYMTMDGVISSGVAEAVAASEAERAAQDENSAEVAGETTDDAADEATGDAESDIKPEAAEANTDTEDAHIGESVTENTSDGEDAADSTDTVESAADTAESVDDAEAPAADSTSDETSDAEDAKPDAVPVKDKEVSDTGDDETNIRELSDEEKELFGTYITKKSTSRQIIYALDNMSMASYTGNCIVTGEEGVRTIDLAKKLIKYMQVTDANFVSNQVAKVSGKGLNDKDIPALLSQVKGGAIIIESARGMKKSTAQKLIKALENEDLGVLCVLEDTSEGMDRIVGTLPKLGEIFNVRIDLKALDDKALVDYAREYALSQEHAIDEFALLALHSRIADLQTSTHQVSVAEVRDLVDDAIYYADKKNPAHLFDIILHKRYDNEDMVILREKDFMHY